MVRSLQVFINIALYKHFVRPGWKPVNKKLTVFKDEDEKKGLLFDSDIY